MKVVENVLMSFQIWDHIYCSTYEVVSWSLSRTDNGKCGVWVAYKECVYMNRGFHCGPTLESEEEREKMLGKDLD